MTQAVTPYVDQQNLGPLASRLVDVPNLPWRETRYPGITVKPLLKDSSSGLTTVLMRMAPGARLPDHEHVLIEQTWVIEGHLVDLEGPDAGMECRAGQFIWRPAGSRHAAWSPQGGTFIAIFQIPNKFYEANGQVKDISGEDWADLWGAAHQAK